MDIFVFDSNYKAVGVLESPTSISYIRRSKAAGEFAVTIPITDFNSELVKKDNILLFEESEGIAGVIDKFKKKLSQDNAPVIEISGGLCEKYIYKRIIWGQYVKSGTITDIVKDLVTTQVISPSDEKRAISDIEINDEVQDKGESIRYQNTGGVVGTAVEELCSTGDVCFGMKYDYNNKKMVFNLFKGIDRTKGQDQNAPCIFSKEYENILESNYEENYTSYRNVALVAGEGEGENRKYVTAGNDSLKGKQRHEVFVDARDLQKSDGTSTIPDDEYEGMLLQRGKEQLETLQPVLNFDCTINTIGNWIYGRDYFLGDKVTIEDLQILDAEITEVEVAYDSSGGQSLYITFGYNQLSLAKAIKAKVVN